MAFYDNSQWPTGPGQAQRQPSWEAPPPSRSGTSSVGAPQESGAFLYQLAEVERAIDNLVKSGKMPFGFFAAAGGPGPVYGQGAHRAPVGGDFDGRPHSNSGLQNYYQNQRGGYGSHRGNQGGGAAAGSGGEQAQMEQAKRRMAAQRERELRNYHQEQQYAKSITTSANNGPKSDRSMSPNTGMSEDERRELILRQHRALYGNESNLYEGKNAGSRPGSGDARNLGPLGGRGGGSPLAYDPYGQGGPEAPRGGDAHGNKEASGSTSHSPASNQNPTFGGNDNARTSNSSPTGGSPPGNKGPGAGVIGSRPAGSQAPIQGLQKRSTTPLPSPLSYGFSANDQNANERSTSASSQDKGNVGLGWGNNSGVWGNSKSGLGVQASVWG